MTERVSKEKRRNFRKTFDLGDAGRKRRLSDCLAGTNGSAVKEYSKEKGL